MPACGYVLFTLPSLHALNVCAKLATSGLVPGRTLDCEAQDSFWPGESKAGGCGQAQPPSSLRLLLTGAHHVTAIIMPILPADHVPGPPNPLPLD